MSGTGQRTKALRARPAHGWASLPPTPKNQAARIETLERRVLTLQKVAHELLYEHNLQQCPTCKRLFRVEARAFDNHTRLPLDVHAECQGCGHPAGAKDFQAPARKVSGSWLARVLWGRGRP